MKPISIILFTLLFTPLYEWEGFPMQQKTQSLYQAKGKASYYADKFNGRRTSSGIRFNNNKYTAAHRKLPFGTKLKVTNESNGKWVIVEVIDRGPFSKGREIDLTKRAFMEIASNKNSGVILVKLEIIEN